MSYFKQYNGITWRLDDDWRTWVNNGGAYRHEVHENINADESAFYKVSSYEAPVQLPSEYLLIEYESCSREEVLQYLGL